MGGGKRRYCRREVERKERIKRKVEGRYGMKFRVDSWKKMSSYRMVEELDITVTQEDIEQIARREDQGSIPGLGRI